MTERQKYNNKIQKCWEKRNLDGRDIRQRWFYQTTTPRFPLMMTEVMMTERQKYNSNKVQKYQNPVKREKRNPDEWDILILSDHHSSLPSYDDRRSESPMMLSPPRALKPATIATKVGIWLDTLSPPGTIIIFWWQYNISCSDSEKKSIPLRK